jgi:type I restriction enzyme M protein
MVSEALRQRFMSLLTELGASAGNGRMLAELGWQEKTYWRVHEALVADGAILKGRGRGGSVRIAELEISVPKEERDTKAVFAVPAKPLEEPTASARTKASSNEPPKADYRATLWAAADKLRGNMDAAEYKHVALGLIFLKYISDRFAERRAEAYNEPDTSPELAEELSEERDWYTAKSVFWVPQNARWDFLKSNATSTEPTIGALIDRAMIELEAENSSLKGVLTKNYARPELDQTKLGEVIGLFTNLTFQDEHHGQDVLGQVYEYFLGQFAIAEGKRGGQFYTAGCVVRLLVEMIQPFKGRVYDPCCGSGGMFVQSEQFVSAHNGQQNDVSIFGQESNPTTWRLAKMNLAIRGIEANLGSKWADSFHDDLHPGLKADFVLANPPFNNSDWGGEKLRGGDHWTYGIPPAGNANFAWVQHFIHHLAPHGIAGFVLANGSLSSQQSGEGEIRKNIVEADLVDCIVSLPGQLFATTQIPVCLWFIARDKSNGILKDRKLRDRRRQTLFIDARALGSMANRTLKVLADSDVRKISSTYHNWRQKDAQYEDSVGFSKTVTTAEISKQNYVLTPGRYVGTAEQEADNAPFEARMSLLSATLQQHLAEGRRLDERIQKALSGVGYGW